MISIIIPCFHDYEYLNRCISSISPVSRTEIVPVFDVIGAGNARNEGAKKAKGEILVFVDADCTVSKTFIEEVQEKSINPYFVGGGTKFVHLDKLSLGRLVFLIPLGIYLYLERITVGAFWVRKEVFNELGGFRDIPFEDIDFALRLKRFAKKTNRKFESLKRSHIVWSTRGFDKHGEWHWLKGYKIFHSPKTITPTTLQ